MARYLVLAVTAAACAFVAEGFARFVLELRPLSYVVPPEIGRYDADLGWSLREDAVAVGRPFGAPIEYRINSAGMRDDEVPVSPPPGEFRVVLLGDSNSFGFGVRIEDHFSKLIESDGLDVVNLAVGGYGVDQELLRLKRDGFQYSPAVVLAMVDGSYPDDRHVHSSRFGFEKPRFRLERDQLILEGAPVPEPSSTRDSPWRAPHRLMRRTSAAYEALRNAFSADSLPSEIETSIDRLEVFELGDRIVLEMNRECRERGVRFVLGALDARLAEVGRAHQLELIDLSDIAANPDYDLPRGLQHFNAAGNRALAERISESLRRERN